MSRRSRLGAALAVVIAVALAGLAVWAVIEGRGETAREAAQDEAVRAPQRVSTVAGAPVITLDAAAQRAAGIETVRLANAPHQERLRAYGIVLDLQKLTELGNSYASAKAQLAVAQAKLAATQTAFDRADKLYKDRQNMSAAQFQAAESAFRVDQARLAAAASQVRTLALTAQQDWGPALGQAVVDGSALLDRLIARQEVLLQVTLRAGQRVAQPPSDASVQLDDGRPRRLHFVSAATKTDPRLQGLSFYFTAPGDSGLLPGMSVVAFLPAGPTVEAAVVPRAAVVWQGGRAWIYLRTGPTTFAPRPIATDQPAPGEGYLVRGLPNEAAVVVRGAALLVGGAKPPAAPAEGEDED